MSIRNTYPTIRPSLNLDFARSRTLDPRITFSRTTTGTYMDSDGLIKVASADEARFDHKYEDGNIVSLGLLVEEQRSNLITYSDQLDEQYNWVDSGTNWSANTIISPDGTQNADDPGFVSEKWGFYDDTNSSWISGYPQNYPFTVTSEWVRHSATITTPSGCTTLRFYPLRSGNDTSYIYQRVGVSTSTTYTASAYYKLADDGTTVIAWGAQLEAGAFPTSYIPNGTDSQATRNPDIVSMEGDNFSDWYNQSEGSIFMQSSLLDVGNTTGKVLWSINQDGVFGEGFYMVNENNQTSITINAFYGGSNQAQFGGPTGITTNQYQKIIFSYQENNVNACFDGTLGIADTSVGIATVGRLVIGNNAWGNILNPGDCHISKLSYYPRRLSNSQLQNLTK